MSPRKRRRSPCSPYSFEELHYTIKEINTLLASISRKVDRDEVRDGLSAYEVAVKHGYRGTEEQWLASLRGPSGEPLTYADLTPTQIKELQLPAVLASTEMKTWLDEAVKNMNQLGTDTQKQTTQALQKVAEATRQAQEEAKKKWYPTVDFDGNLSWELSKTDTPPDTVNIKGPAGGGSSSGETGGFTEEELKSIIRAYGAQLFLSKTRPDATSYLLRLLGGAHFGEFASSLMNGTGGSIDDHGNAELETLRLRSALIVKELIMNRWTAQEGNTTFTEAGTIDAVQLEEDGTYTLAIRRRWEYDVTAFSEQDVCYGSVNDLSQGGGKYRDAWFRVLSVNRTANTLSVVMYPDNEVPGGQNYAPEVGMVVTRRGNATDTERQGFWYLSSYEGCICFLDGVTKPILEESNYAIIIGKLKRLSLFDNLPINYLHSYVYCRGMAIQDLLRIDYEGNPVVTLNDRGFWSLETAQGDNPYTAGQETVDTVWHYGCRWRCLVTGTTDEPRYSSTGWAMIEGNPAFTIAIDSSAGWAFDAGQLTDDVPFTTLTVTGQLYNRDVTEHLLDADISWTRDTGNVAEDNAWAIKKAGAGKSLPLVADDLGLEFKQKGVCSFKCTAVLRDGQDMRTAEDIVTF